MELFGGPLQDSLVAPTEAPGSPQEGPKGAPRRPREVSGPPGDDAPEPSPGDPETSRGRLGALPGLFGSLPRLSWVPLGALWGTPSPSKTIFREASCLERPWPSNRIARRGCPGGEEERENEGEEENIRLRHSRNSGLRDAARAEVVSPPLLCRPPLPPGLCYVPSASSSSCPSLSSLLLSSSVSL